MAEDSVSIKCSNHNCPVKGVRNKIFHSGIPRNIDSVDFGKCECGGNLLPDNVWGDSNVYSDHAIQNQLFYEALRILKS